MWMKGICQVSRLGKRSTRAENLGCTWGRVVWEQGRTSNTPVSWASPVQPGPANWAHFPGQLSKLDLQRAAALSYSITPERWAGQSFWKGKRECFTWSVWPKQVVSLYPRRWKNPRPSLGAYGPPVSSWPDCLHVTPVPRPSAVTGRGPGDRRTGLHLSVGLAKQIYQVKAWGHKYGEWESKLVPRAQFTH